MEWKSIHTLTITSFDDHGRIDDENAYWCPQKIDEKNRLLNVPLQDIDEVVLPKMRMDWGLRTDNGKLVFCRVPRQYV